jgi:hypothetical protein
LWFLGVSRTSRWSSKECSLIRRQPFEQKPERYSEILVLLNGLRCSMNEKTVWNDASMQKANISETIYLIPTCYSRQKKTYRVPGLVASLVLRTSALGLCFSDQAIETSLFSWCSDAWKNPEKTWRSVWVFRHPLRPGVFNSETYISNE